MFYFSFGKGLDGGANYDMILGSCRWPEGLDDATDIS